MPPPVTNAAEKKGKWIDINEPVKKKEEEKKPQPAPQNVGKKGKGF